MSILGSRAPKSLQRPPLEQELRPSLDQAVGSSSSASKSASRKSLPWLPVVFDFETFVITAVFKLFEFLVLVVTLNSFKRR